MSSTYSTRIRLNLQGTGDGLNQWGTILNSGALQLTDDAIGGYVTIDISAQTTTLTANSGSTDQARMAFLLLTGTNTSINSVIIASVSKGYWVVNNATSAVNIKCAGGLGYNIPGGTVCQVICDSVSVIPGSYPVSIGTRFITSVHTTAFSGSGTYAKPSNLVMLYVEGIGAGGGGAGGYGGAATSIAGGGSGGGAGAYSNAWLSNAAIAATTTITIGAAGTGGTAASVVGGTGTSGTTGGDTNFGAVVIAKGGVGGGGAGQNGGSGAPGSGGDATASTGQNTFWGGDGFPGGSGAPTVSIAGNGGNGGPSFLGGGGSGGRGSGPAHTPADGNGSGRAYGAGGGGGNGAGGNGGPGTGGLVLITEYLF